MVSAGQWGRMVSLQEGCIATGKMGMRSLSSFVPRRVMDSDEDLYLLVERINDGLA